MSTSATIDHVPNVQERPRLTLAVVATSHAAAHMYNALMPIIYPSTMARFGFGYSEIGLMSAAGNAVGSIVQGIFGFLTRRLPRRVLLGLGNFFMAIGMVLTGFTGNFASFFGLYVMNRVSQSPQHPVGNAMISDGFDKRNRGTAFAINFAGGNVGSLMVPFFGTLLLVAYGWRAAMMVFAILPLLIGLICIVVIPEQRRTRAPNEGKKTSIGSLGREWLSPLKDPNIALVTACGALAAGGRGIGVIMTNVPLYLQLELRVEPAHYVALYTLLMAGSVVGPLITGRIADSFGLKRMAIITLLLSLASTLGILGAGNEMVMLTLAVALMGMMVYSQSSLIQAFLADVTRRDKLDQAYSVYFTLAFMAGAAWSYVIGLVIDNLGFNAAFIVMSFSYLAGMIALLPVGRGSRAIVDGR